MTDSFILLYLSIYGCTVIRTIYESCCCLQKIIYNSPRVVSTQRVSWGLLGNVNFNRSHAWFCLLFPPSLGCLSKRRQQERMKRWWGWVESFLLSHSQRMSFSSIDHAAFTGLEKLRVVCNLFFSRRSGINSVTNLAVSDIHGRLRALISIFLSCH